MSESIVPRENLVEGTWDYTPVLRADATDDNLEEEKPEGTGGKGKVKWAEGGTVKPGKRMVCPVCGLEACQHNLEYVEAKDDD